MDWAPVCMLRKQTSNVLECSIMTIQFIKTGDLFGEVESETNDFLIPSLRSVHDSTGHRFVPDFENRNMWGDGDSDGGEPRRGRMVQVQLSRGDGRCQKPNALGLLQVLGIWHDGTFDNETTTLMQVVASPIHALKRRARARI